jgi:hypothetical protein
LRGGSSSSDVTGTSVLFPYLGFDYGVLAASTFQPSTALHGWAVSDDEDTHNGSYFRLPSNRSANKTEVYAIIQGNPDVKSSGIATYTQFNLAKVMPTQPVAHRGRSILEYGADALG